MKPDNVHPFMPLWPTVRCSKCAEVYVMPTTGTPEFRVIVGNCPRCGHESFNTTMTGNVSSFEAAS